MDSLRIHCNMCAATFSRRSHYDRHLHTHTDTKPYACQVCGQRFNRVDSLGRHGNAIHSCNPTPGKKYVAWRGRVSRACMSCKRSKVKCDSEIPCHRCQRTGVNCYYGTNYKDYCKSPVRNAHETIRDRPLQDGAPLLPYPREDITQPCTSMGSAIIIPNIANGESTGPELNPTDESLGRVTSDSACCAAADLLGWSLMPQSTFNERLGRLDGGNDDQAPGGKQAIVEWRKHVPLSPDVDEQLESSHVLDLLLEIAKWHSLVNDGPLDRDNT